MLHNLTDVANYRNLRLVKTERLAGLKYAVKFAEGKEIYVSPAVYELVSTDLDAVAEVLMVHILPGHGFNTRRGGR